MLRGLLAVSLAGLLVLSLFGANVAIALDRGPLDADHVSDSAAEAGVYELAQSEALAIVEDELAGHDDELPVSIDGLLEQVVTADWIRAEADRNLAAVEAHLENGEPLDLYVSTDRFADDAAAALQHELDEEGYAAFGLDPLDRLTANATSYEAERLALRSDLLVAAGYDRDDGFGHDPLAGMVANESSYAAERDAQYAAMADAMLADSRAATGFGSAELEALLADEDYFEQRQREIPDPYRDEVETEIAAAIDEELEDVPPPVHDAGGEIAALTADALTSEMAHDEFTASYDEIVAELRTDVHAHLRTHAGDYDDRLRAHVEAELDAAGVPDPVEPAVDRLADLVVESLTTDMRYDTFLAAYEPIADDLEAAAGMHLWEHRADYEESLEAAVAAELGVQEVPPAVQPELDAAVDVVMAAVLTDMEYEEFLTAFEAAETEFIDAAVAHHFDDEDAVPARIELAGHAPDEAALEPARTAVSAVQALVFVLPLVSIALVGSFYALTRDVVLTAATAGIGAMIAGASGYLVAVLMPPRFVAATDGTGAPADAAPVLGAFLEGLLAPLATQSLLLGAGGLAVVGGSIAIGRGLHEPIVVAIRERTAEQV